MDSPPYDEEEEEPLRKINNKLFQLEEKIATVGALRNDLMLEKDSIRAELIKTEQEKMDLHNEKAGLDHSLILTEKSREKLEQDLMAIHREKADLADSLAQVSEAATSLKGQLGIALITTLALP